MHLDAPVGQHFGDQLGGAQLFKTELGVGVNVATHSRNAGRLGDEGVKNFHADSLAGEREVCQRKQ